MASTLAANRNPTDRNADATVHVGQLDDRVTDALLWELMVQAAPVRHVYIPRNRITGKHFGYGFCEFFTPLDAYYATMILNLVHLHSKPIRISPSTIDRQANDIGANLFIGNLVDEVDEKVLHDAFSAFGPLVDAPYIMRDSNTNESRSYGFIKYATFEHSDAAIAAMNGQYICNTPITVQYAFKKDSERRERHGSEAERILAQRGRDARRAASLETYLPSHVLFSDRPVPKNAVQHPSGNVLPHPPIQNVRPPPSYVIGDPSRQIQQQHPPYVERSGQIHQWQQPHLNQGYADMLQVGQQHSNQYPPGHVQAPQVGWSQNRHSGARSRQEDHPTLRTQLPPRTGGPER